MTPKTKRQLAKLLQAGVHLCALAPLLWLFWAIPAGKLGGDPVEELIHYLGVGGLRLLLLTLLVTPLARALAFPQMIRIRRPLGLWSFFWVSLHFATWMALDLGFTWGLIGEEIVKRTYILVGFTVWLILAALAVTSIPRLVRTMGKRWKKLHRWIYPAAILGCIHFWWSLKSGWIEPAIYLLLAGLLVSARLRPARSNAPPLSDGAATRES